MGKAPPANGPHWERQIAAGADTLIRGRPDGSFDKLSHGLQQKFQNAGGVYRPLLEAESFFQDDIPYRVRNLGEDAVKRFLDGKDWSHELSKQNAPHLAEDSGNGVWEASGSNRARGSDNMTELELRQARHTNAIDARGIVFRNCLETAKMTAFYSALLEAPVSAIENMIHYHKGRKTGEEAIKDAATSITMRAAIRGAVGFAVTGAVALGARAVDRNRRPYPDDRRIAAVRIQRSQAHLERAEGRPPATPGRHLLLQPPLPYHVRL